MSTTGGGGGSDAALQDQITALQTQLQTLQASATTDTRIKPVKNVKIPEGFYNMSPSDFRTYKKDITDYQKLTLHTDRQVVMEMRLNMDIDLKRSIDINYSADWDTYTVENALSAVRNMVLRTSNVAVYQKEFDNIVQKSDETILEFVTRLRTCASDCSFVCPYDEEHDLTDYHLITRLRSGVFNETLQQELLQKHDTINTVDLIITYCEAFESAVRDKDKLTSSSAHASQTDYSLSVSNISSQFDISDEEIVAAVSQYKRNKRFSKRGSSPSQNHKKCGSCGYNHASDGCPAAGKICLGCGKPNHFAAVCRSPKPCPKCGKNGHNEKNCPVNALANAAVIIGSIQKVLASVKNDKEVPLSLPRIAIRANEKETDAIPDTGALVSVAGLSLLEMLGIDIHELLRPVNILKHVGGGRLEVLGYCPVSIQHNNVTLTEHIFFVLGVDTTFLSLNACKEFRLVHRSFPHVDVTKVNHEANCNNTIAAAALTEPKFEQLCLPERPDKIPYPPTEENIPLLHKYLLQVFSRSTFNVDAKPLPTMSGPPFHIHLEDEPVKHAVHTPAPVPHYWKEEVAKMDNDDVEKGVLHKVAPGYPVEWCHRRVVVPKHDGSPRRVVDFQPLNKFCKRETHLSPTPFEAVSSIPAHMYKTKTDAYNGYHQVPLDEDSQKLTTFITENGRYQYLRAPQGLSSSGDAYVHRYDDIIQGVEQKVKVTDDVLLYDENVETAFFHVFDYLYLCGQNGVTLNPSKFVFCQKDLDFCGFYVGWEGFRPSDKMMNSIKEFPMPEKPTISDMRAWFGLVNQVAPFLVTTDMMKPFRELLKGTSKTVYWDEYLQSAFEQSKQEICKLIESGLACFQKDRKTALITDYSGDGLGAILLQKACICESEIPFCCSDGWKLILCCSRGLKPAEENYSPQEGEALAIAWSLKKFKMFLLGHPGFIVITDHRPLVKTFNDKELKDIDNPRIFKMKEKSLMYRFETMHIEGKKNCAANTLSRYPLKVCRNDLNEEDEDDFDTLELHVKAVIGGISVQPDVLATSLDELMQVALIDPIYVKLLSKIKNNSFCKTSASEDPDIRPYFNIRDRLSICDNVIMYTYEDRVPRLLIPHELRKRVLKNLHSAHQGLSATMSRARQTVYWPGLEKSLQREIDACKDCVKNAKSQSKEPLLASPVPEYPMQYVVSDLFSHNDYLYLVYACRLTGWPELAHFPITSKSSDVLAALREFFHRWGVPEEIALDGASNLSSKELTEFLQRWGVRRRLSSAYFPQSNGRAEAAVKSMKRLIQGHTGPRGSINTDEIALGLLQYRNTPIEGGKSPAQLALGRELKDTMPLPRQRYHVNYQWKKLLKQRELDMAVSWEKQKQTFDQSAKPLQQLCPYTDVVCQNPKTNKWDRSGKVVECLPYRQYRIKLDGTGRITLRNRRHLRTVYRGAPCLQPNSNDNTLTIESSYSNTPLSHTNTTSSCSKSSTDYTPPLVLPRRSNRIRKPPPRFEDYDMS